MSKAITLNDILKSAPTATSLSTLSTLSMLVADQSGVLQKIQPTPVSLGVLPMFRNIIKDADKAVEPGIYRTDPDCINLSKSAMSCSARRGHLLVLSWDGSALTQIFFRWNGDVSIAIRRKSSGTSADGWESWKEVAFTT